MGELSILPFQPQDQETVKKLILTGLVEHWGVLDPTKNPDLNDIQTTYARAVFLVAWLDGEIVGCGALAPRTDQAAEIVRMSVAGRVRRQGVGQEILNRLLEQARALGFQRVILETTATWSEVIQFYLRCGFHITHYQDDDVYFALDLAA